jgi:hypothetical protein
VEGASQTNATDAVPQSNAPDLADGSGLGDGDEAAASESRAGDNVELTPGPLSKDARQEAQELGNLVVKESERIAAKYKKSRREIMLAAGLTTRESRAPNHFNMFRKWYAHHHPMKDTTS